MFFLIQIVAINYINFVRTGLVMNKMTSGFTLLELLVSLMVLMLFLGGFCYLLLILPKSSLYQSSAAMELHKSADFWFALEKDIKHHINCLLHMCKWAESEERLQKSRKTGI